METETIAAIATPLGKGGIGIVRVSGPMAETIAGRLFRAKMKTPAAEMESHRLYFGTLYDYEGRLLDSALCVLMRAPHSYTGEDVAEFQLHGGPRLLATVLQACLFTGARMATPGEFTLRAFLNGRIDLSQAEAVVDVIEAKTPRAARLAAGQVEGRLAGKISQTEEALTALLAEITVGVDFPEDADAPEAASLLPQVDALISQLKDDILAGAETGRICREGLRVALMGAVNVGKSSLMNCLLETERAIVTELPGTTRDLIEEGLELNGVPLLLVDTAGFREKAADLVEQIGMERSRDAMAEAQLALVVVDAAAGLDRMALQLLAETAGRTRLLILNKSDLVSDGEILAIKDQLDAYIDMKDVIVVSARTGEGAAALKTAMLEKSGVGPDQEICSPLVSNARQEAALQRAL